MRKAVTLFLFMFTLAIVFAGAVTAQEVNVAVINENNELVTEANVSDTVNVLVTANNNGETTLEDPAVLIYTDPANALEFSPSQAIAVFNGDEYENDPDDPFFYWDEESEAWVFWIGWYDYYMYPGDVATLLVPAMVTTAGEITVNADFYEWPEENPEATLLDSDSYTFLAIEPPEAEAETVPMQKTGTPLGLAVLGLLAILGGAVYGKFR